MSKKNTRKLVVKKETLREISSSDLGRVQGGAIISPYMVGKNNCTARLSGCISMC